MIEPHTLPPLLATIAALLLVGWKLLHKPPTNAPELFRPASTLPLLGNTHDLLWFQKHRLHDWMSEQSLASGSNKPERWIDDKTGKLKNISSFQFVTFSAGPRQCIGMRLAMMDMMTVLAVIYSRFDLKTVEDASDITYDFSLVLPVKGSLAVRVQSLAAHKA